MIESDAMDRTLKMMMLGLAILVVCHAASINVTRNGDQGKNVNLRLLTSLTLGNVDSKKSGLDLGTNMNLKISGLDLETNVNLKTSGLDSSMGRNVDSKTTGLDRNCTLGTTGQDLGTTASCTNPFKKVGGKCYYFGGESVTFSEAAKKCFDLGSILATVGNKSENAELYNAMSKAHSIEPRSGQPRWDRGYYIGGFNVDNGKTWQFYTGQPIDYKPWCGGEPDGANSQFCIHASGQPHHPACFSTMPCEWKRAFVCQRH